MNTARGRQPVGRERGDVTRYLCAGAYLDDAFADRVVEEILFDEASAVAPAPTSTWSPWSTTASRPRTSTTAATCG
ncbi:MULTISPECIES: hypothetical protein [unclassified Streptomyces]|uniref:hypothetical protein n=1 Tax=unclassified Streptomyces TaxID=2593676 RepID=UPI00081B0268|nr:MULTISPECIES: hypothetical protein [unclassified Streptomyces]MYQ67696.1 hypothetical protein [Streptomyces sp. SID4950]SCE38797.1 hypothetical protein GA0115242_13512 [Streptomyces sp. SolWspMP-5a-2]